MSKDYKQYQEGLIRSILARPDEIVNVIDYVDSKDFEDVNFKMIYESILELHLENKPISLPEIALKIGDSGGAIDTSWLLSLNNNMAQWVQAAPPRAWARLLKRESIRNVARETLKEGLAEIDKKELDPLNSLDKTTNNLSKVSIDATASQLFDIDEAIDRFEEETREILKTGGMTSSINSAYPTIDHYTQGWGATHLITVGARTGVGKSVFAVNNVVSAMYQDKSVLFFSLEMSEREVISRIVSSIAMIPIQKIEKALPLTDDEVERQKDALKKIRESKLKIDTNPHVTIEYIKRVAIKQAQSEDGLDFIVIDYLQLISNEGKRNRQEAVADVSRNMKIIAKELNVPVMVLVQLNREKRDDEDTTPKIYDIRESGAIAQDSNVVVLIDRDMNDDSESIDPKATFIIAKNRQGEANKYITVRTRLDCSLFIDDNVKGQKLLQDIEASIEQDGDYEVNFDSTAYQEVPEEFKQEISQEDLDNLFTDDNAFGDEGHFDDGSSFEDYQDYSTVDYED